MPAGVVTNIISLGCLATCCLTESISSSVRRAYWPFVFRGFDPDGEELGAQIPLADADSRLRLPPLQRVGKVKVLIDKALRGVGVGVDDNGGAMNRCGVLRFSWHFVGQIGWGLGANQRRDGEQQQSERDMGGHRLGMSLYPKSRV
jgi:hypothetical protein